MTELEKKAYAYVIERQKDPNYPTYNWETEISDAYEQGYKNAIGKACEWINENIYKYTWIDYTQMEFGINRSDLLSALKQAMEEQE